MRYIPLTPANYNAVFPFSVPCPRITFVQIDWALETFGGHAVTNCSQLPEHVMRFFMDSGETASYLIDQDRRWVVIGSTAYFKTESDAVNFKLGL